MPYEVLLSKRVDKELHKFPSQIRIELVTETLKLAESPQLGEQLKGVFRTFRSLHIKIKNVHYRVIYEVIEAEKQVYLHAVGKRENFYRQIEQMKLKALKAA